MKKKTKIILLAVVIGILIGSIYGILRVTTGEKMGKNLLKNSNFEMVDRAGKLESWVEGSKGGWSVDTEGAYEGEKCMEATVGWSWLSQDVRIRSKRYYLLKAYMRSDISIPGEVDEDNAFLGFDCINKKGEFIKSDYGIISATSSWQQEVRRIYAPQGTNKIRVKIAKRQGEGSVWFDRLELKQAPSISVLNPSFEMLDKLGRPKYWKEDFRGGWSVDTEESYEEKRCMQATVGWSWLSQEIPARPQKYYTLSAHLKSDIAFPEKKEDWNAFLALECLDKEHKIITEQMKQLKATSFWQSGKIGLYAPENTDKIRVKLAKRKGEGSVWFDSLKIMRSGWYMKIKFLRRIAEDKPFFIFYFSLYFILLVSLLRLILKR